MSRNVLFQGEYYLYFIFVSNHQQSVLYLFQLHVEFHQKCYLNLFLVLNLVSFTVIAVGYVWMYFAARTTQLAVTKDRRSTESAMAWRMSLLVITDAACWVPIIVLGLASLVGFTVPPQVILFTLTYQYFFMHYVIYP